MCDRLSPRCRRRLISEWGYILPVWSTSEADAAELLSVREPNQEPAGRKGPCHGVAGRGLR